jgi:hypothetical protein
VASSAGGGSAGESIDKMVTVRKNRVKITYYACYGLFFCRVKDRSESRVEARGNQHDMHVMINQGQPV